MPKISVIMPVYNGDKYLKEAVDSILNQTFSDFEFIIIDDGSTDNTEQIIKSYDDKRILYIKNEQNLGVAESLNKGLDMAKGEYIARMDADDISLPERFEKQLQYMERHKNIAVCGSSIECFGAVKNKRSTAPCGKKKIRLSLLIKSGVFHPTVIMRRSIIEKEHYRYNAYYDKVEDFELWTRVAVKYRINNIKEVLLRYRIHSNQVTRNYTEEHKNCLLKVRQKFLHTLGAELTDDEIRALNDCFIEEINYDEQTESLISALKKIIDVNRKSKFFDESLLRKHFSKIVLRSARMQNIYSKKELIELSGFVTRTEMQIDRLKCFVKRIIGSTNRQKS